MARRAARRGAHRATRRGARRGSTPRELIVVVAGALLALVEPGPWHTAGPSYASMARTQMAAFAAAIEQYRLTHEKLPASLDDLTRTDARNPAPFMATVPLDPWHVPYDYRPRDRRTYTLTSYGEDGLAETEDDLAWPERDE